ncbi:MAG: SCO family protein [Campylobacterales bacterium]|nr:SCO family protein [Campylobacterales bacterium]
MVQRLILILFPLLLAVGAYFYVIPTVKRKHYDFTLQSADGPVSLSDFRGKKAVAIYFGYTYCPDICPTTFSNLTGAMKLLPPEAADAMQVIFVSVDTDRDTPQSLKEYVEYFYPTYLGVTGSKTQIDEVVSRYDGTEYTIIKGGSKAMGYTVGHTSYVYFFDKQGNFSSRLNHSIDPRETLTHMEKALGIAH